MIVTTASQTPRRQQRRLRNDDVILDTAVRLAAAEGWAGLTPGHVAEASGLSRPTVLQRHPCRTDVGVALWTERVWHPLRDALGPLVAAVDGETGTTQATESALDTFLAPTAQLRAAVELLVVSTYVDSLAEAVQSTFGTWLASLLSEVADEVAARRAFAVGSALGLVLQAQALAGWAQRSVLELRFWAEGLSTQRPAVELPPDSAVFSGQLAFNTGDATRDVVLKATIDSVSEVGYEAATIEFIAARCGFTRTVIFRRYPTKYDLFLDASGRTLGPVILGMDEYRRKVERQWGTAASDAWFGREVMRPELRGMRTIILEQVRLAAHHHRLRTVLGDALTQPERPMAHLFAGATGKPEVGKQAVEFAMAAGMLLLAQLRPQAWSLPYEVVLVPWRAAQEGR